MATHDPLAIQDPSSFEKHIGTLFQNSNWEVIVPPANTRGYDLELRRDKLCVAVQIKNYTRKCSFADLEKFKSFLELPLAAKFTHAFFVSASGFSKNVLLDAEASRRERQEQKAQRDALAKQGGQPAPAQDETLPRANASANLVLVNYCNGKLEFPSLESSVAEAPDRKSVV